MTTTVMAILMLDGRARMVCVGCTTRLAELGMVRAVGEKIVNERQPDFVATTYEIAAPFTLENCRGMLRGLPSRTGARHIGPPWGE